MPTLPFQTRLPGVYFEIESVPRPVGVMGVQGVVMAMLPLPWYEENEPITISAREFLNIGEAYRILGFSAFTFDNEYNRLVSLLMNGAAEAIIFPQYTGGTPAQGVLDGVTFKAVKLGEMGNLINVQITAMDDRFAVTTFFKGRPMGRPQIIQTMDDFVTNNFVEAVFPEGTPVPLGQLVLEGGTNGALPNYDVRLGAFLYAADADPRWTSIAFSMELGAENFEQARFAFMQWLRQYNNDMQRDKYGVVPVKISEGVDNWECGQVWTGVEINREKFTIGEATLLRAGHYAGTPVNRDEVNKVMPGMTDVDPLPNLRERQDAVNRGMFTYVRNEDGQFVVLDDVNSFVSLTLTHDEVWRFNRCNRVRDEMKFVIARIFNRGFKGRVDDSQAGREKFHGALHAQGQTWEENSVILNHQFDNITVERGDAPRTWAVTWHNVEVAFGVIIADVHMTITW